MLVKTPERKLIIKISGEGVDRIPQDDLESYLLEEVYRIVRLHADGENLNAMTTFVSVLESPQSTPKRRVARRDNNRGNSPMTHNTAQPIPDTEGEWRVAPEPAAPVIAEIHCGNKIIAGLLTTETANQIVADHRAAKSQALLVEALRLAKTTIVAFADEEGLNSPEELIAVRYIDAALKAAGVEK